MKLAFEYGHGLMEANLPDNTDIFIPGETIPDPPYLENPKKPQERPYKIP